jgi:hypothetical protein
MTVHGGAFPVKLSTAKLTLRASATAFWFVIPTVMRKGISRVCNNVRPRVALALLRKQS